jgi:alkylation response protein AidB-like acyl-CoA dehydrogenase
MEALRPIQAPPVPASDYGLPRSDDPLAAVQRLSQLIRAKAADAEKNVRLDDEVVAALVADGTMALMVPACLGGGEAEPSVLIDVIEELSCADGSTGWAIMASMASHGTFLSVIPDAGVDAVLRSDNYLCAGAIAPPGRARPVDGGYLISGRFSFGSGSVHAGWFIGGYALVDEEGVAVLAPDGRPKLLAAVVPRSKAKVLGNWDVMGLVATGSYDYEVPEQFISHDFIAPGEHAVRGGALYGMGLKSLPGTGHAAVALGIGRRALEEFQELAQRKSRPPSGLLAGHEVLQREFAIWTAQLRSARAFVNDAYTRLFEATRDGRPTDAAMKADCRLATTHAVMTAAEVARSVYINSGSEGLRNGSVIQRCFRDAFAASQHLFTADQVYVEAGRIYLRTPGLTPAHLDMMTTTYTPPLNP